MINKATLTCFFPTNHKPIFCPCFSRKVCPDPKPQPQPEVQALIKTAINILDKLPKADRETLRPICEDQFAELAMRMNSIENKQLNLTKSYERLAAILQTANQALASAERNYERHRTSYMAKYPVYPDPRVVDGLDRDLADIKTSLYRLKSELKSNE